MRKAEAAISDSVPLQHGFDEVYQNFRTLLEASILRLARIDPEREYFITDRGKEVLKSAQEITRALGIDSDLNTSLR